MIALSQSIRQITAEQPSTLKVFERFKIDARSEGDKSLKEVCDDLQLSIEQVVEKLTEAESHESGQREFDPKDLTLAQIIQHIVRTHHHRIRRELPSLVRAAQAPAETGGEHANELNQIKRLVEQLHTEMFAHLEHEEEVLFPFIDQMEDDSALDYHTEHASLRGLSYPVFIMAQKHESSTRILAELRLRTHNFSAPDGASPTHCMLLEGLRNFEADLKQHLHLENNVLFPRALRMEAGLQRRR